jgi:hypothetical protein
MWRRCVRIVFVETNSSAAISGALRLLGRYLTTKAGIIQYQVRQTEHGAQIAIRGHADADELENELRHALDRLDLQGLELTITTQARIERQDTGKITRFLPLRERRPAGRERRVAGA